MQLSKENSDAGAATGASSRSACRPPGPELPGGPAPRPLAARPGTAWGPGAPARPSPPCAEESRAPQGPSGRTGGAPGARHLPREWRGAQNTPPLGARPRGATPSPAPGVPSPGRRGGARLPGLGVRLSPGAGACELVPHPRLLPARASRPLLNLQVARRGKRACALGLREGAGRGGSGVGGAGGVGLVPGGRKR